MQGCPRGRLGGPLRGQILSLLGREVQPGSGRRPRRPSERGRSGACAVWAACGAGFIPQNGSAAESKGPSGEVEGQCVRAEAEQMTGEGRVGWKRLGSPEVRPGDGWQGGLHSRGNALDATEPCV